MNKLLLTFSVIFFTYYVNAQVIFNNADSIYHGPTMRNVIIHNNNYYTIGGSSINNILGIVVNKFNLDGEIIETKYYADTCQWYHGAENSLQATGTGNYILAGNIEKGLYGANLLVKFDSNFDTIFTKRYNSVYDINNCGVINYNSCVGNDGNYLMVGYTNMTNNYDTLQECQIQLIKTDTLGNLLWRKLIGDTINEYAGYKIINSFEGGYIIGGWCAKNGGDWCVVKVDENGENPILKNFGHSYYDDGRVGGITALSDSTYIVVGVISVDYENGRARVLKLDKNLNIIWDSIYGKTTHSTGFIKCIEQENKDLVFLGNYKSSYLDYIATVTRTDSAGNLLWQKETGYLDTVQTDNVTMDMKQTTDGGYIFTGFISNGNLTPHQQMWLVKTDSLGCDGTEFTCGVTQIPEFSVQNNESGLRVWPNPAKESLTLTLSKGEEISDVQNTHSLHNKSKGITKPVSFPPLGELKGAFNTLTIQEKLKYSSKNPNNTYWGEKERQQMREIQYQYAYMLPFEAINGKVDIFAREALLNSYVIANNNVIARKYDEAISLNKQNATSQAPRNNVQKVRIYDIFGRVIKTSIIYHTEHSEVSSFSVNVSSLKNGVYIVKIGEYSAKFVKE